MGGEGAEDETRVGPGGKQGRPKMRGKAYFVADAFTPFPRGPRLAPRPPPGLPPGLPSSFPPEAKAEVWVSPEETVLGAPGAQRARRRKGLRSASRGGDSDRREARSRQRALSGGLAALRESRRCLV